MFGFGEWLFYGIHNFPELSVFLFTFLFGDELVYFFSFLSGQGYIALGTVMIFSVLGNGLCDIFWLSVARFKMISKIKRYIRKSPEKSEDEDILLSERKRLNLYYILVASKFFYGTRLLTIFYVARTERSFKRVILLNILAVLSWVLIVSTIVFIIGKWTFVRFEEIQSINSIIGYAVLFVVIAYLFNRFVIAKIIRKKYGKKLGFYGVSKKSLV